MRKWRTSSRFVVSLLLLAWLPPLATPPPGLLVHSHAGGGHTHIHAHEHEAAPDHAVQQHRPTAAHSHADPWEESLAGEPHADDEPWHHHHHHAEEIGGDGNHTDGHGASRSVAFEAGETYAAHWHAHSPFHRAAVTRSLPPLRFLPLTRLAREPIAVAPHFNLVATHARGPPIRPLPA